jgi:citrate lyase beta subunit
LFNFFQDAVPPDEKPKARIMIRDKLKYIRENTFSSKVIITPRTNGLHTGLFELDAKTLITKDTYQYLNG